MWASTFLSPYLHPISSVLYSKLRKSAHQCGVRIGLYTLSSRWGLHMGCHIMKGVSKQCITRLLLTQWYKNTYCPHNLVAGILTVLTCILQPRTHSWFWFWKRIICPKTNIFGYVTPKLKTYAEVLCHA